MAFLILTSHKFTVSNMEITYYVEPQDKLAFQWNALKTNSAIRKTFGFWAIFLFFANFWDLLLALIMSPELFWMLPMEAIVWAVFIRLAAYFGAVAVFGSLTLLAYSILFRKSAGEKQLGVNGQHLIVLEENGFREITDVNNSFHSWQSVTKVIDTAEHLFIYISSNQAHIIPKKYFANQNAAAAFIEVVNEKTEKAKHTFEPSQLANWRRRQQIS